MANEGIPVLEEWFRWAEEWSMLLRAWGRLGRDHRVLEIGCGQGRVAFPLRYVLSPAGGYTGFDIDRGKIERLQQTFTPAHPNFRFIHADVHNTFYNPQGAIPPSRCRFPVEDASQDLVFAASVFTHMIPGNATRYFEETARVLRPAGRAVFSFFLLDHYVADQARPHPFDGPNFRFDTALPGLEGRFATVHEENPEQMTAYARELIAEMAETAGLVSTGDPLPGFWSGRSSWWVSAQDVLILERP
jgi:SAM-dependent methyltransferase